MALIDIDTIKIAIKELKKIKPYLIIYGEPWMGGESVLPMEKQILTGSQRSNGFAVFNDSFRNAIKGDNDGYAKGFIQGNFTLKKQVEIGISGSIDFDEKRTGFADDASEVINYIACHDNLIYLDKLKISLTDHDNLEYISRLGFAILFLSFGKPFIYEGTEFNNSKNNNSNSYNLPLSINGIDWQDKIDNFETFTFVKDLIWLRKKLEVFNLVKRDDIRQALSFVDDLEDNLIAYKIYFKNKKIYIIFNGLNDDVAVDDFKRKKIFGEEISLVKIFDKKGKINKKIKVSELDHFSKHSVNVYIRGENYGL